MSNFGSGSNSNGNFWYGNATNFPGFLYKKNLGVGGRRSTKMAPGGNTTCNSSTDLYNKYKPGGGGVGASSTANRRAKNRLATVCGSSNKCFPCYNTLGQYSSYTHNPNGFVPCPAVTTSSSVTPTPIPSGTYTVTYNGNGNTVGNVPVDGLSPYISGSQVTVLGSILDPSGNNTLVKSGYQFAGWNTKADGTGTNYVGGNTFTMPSQNTTLYANWIIGGVTLRYNAGTGGTGTPPSSSGTSYTAFSIVDVVDNALFTKSGFTFAGWNTAANGSGTSYIFGSKYTMPGANPTYTTIPLILPGVYLYAQWISSSATPTIPLTYKANSAFGGIGIDVSNNYIQNSTADISGNTFPVPFTNDGSNNTFYGWNTDASGNGTSYPPGSTITMNSSKTLFAQWVSPPPYTLIVTYNKNGATTGSDASYNYPGGVQVPILGQGSLTRAGYAFLGWNSDASGNGSVYAPGYTFTSKTVTLFAQWAPGSTVKNCGGGAANNDFIYYNYPFAQVVRGMDLVTNKDTVTIYTTCIMGKTSSNIGLGTAPEGLISVTSKMVITIENITINTNTTWAATDPSYNYAPYNYSKTITNDASGCIYWPTTPSVATITSISFPFTYIPPTSYPPANSPVGTATYSISTRGCTSGCGLSGTGSTVGAIFTSFNFFNQGVTLNYSNSTSTTFISSPNNSIYSTTATNPTPTFIQTPSSLYPYSLITPRSSAALTTVTIIPPSPALEYVYPPLPNYTVEYDGNGATNVTTGGNIPAPVYMSPYTATTSITISGNTGSLTKSTAPSTFSKWNTQANGLGTDYGPGTANLTYAGGASITLYAVWVAP